MSNYQTQLTNLKNYLNTKGDFEIKIQPNDYPPLDNLFYEISHPHFVNTYVNKFRDNNDLTKPPMLDEFIDSVLKKSQAFKQYIEYFESKGRYKIQFLNSKSNQLDVIITHIDTKRKYVTIFCNKRHPFTICLEKLHSNQSMVNVNGSIKQIQS